MIWTLLPEMWMCDDRGIMTLDFSQGIFGPDSSVEAIDLTFGICLL